LTLSARYRFAGRTGGPDILVDETSEDKKGFDLCILPQVFLSASECFIGKWFEFRCGDHLHVAAAENVVDAHMDS
jgi:hypothetical protein